MRKAAETTGSSTLHGAEAGRVGRPPSTKVSIENVTKRFGTHAATDRVSLEIYEGEFLTLLGSSGSGKTTLMRLVAGLEKCDSGTIRIDGKDVTFEPVRQRNLGMVFQQYSLFPHMSVAENIAYGLEVKKWAKHRIAERVQQMLDLVHLPDMGDRLPSQLSGGQQQRIALARALATGPSLLMLDEPLGALDLKLRRQLQAELKRIHQQTGTTFLFVTHDQEEALYLSDRIAVMRDGRIEQLAPPREIYERPVSEFVADFIGDVSLLACERDSDGSIIVIGAGEIPLDLATPEGPFKLVVRPEHVQIHLEPAPGRLSARVNDVVHEGSTTLYDVELGSGVSVKARVLGAATATYQVGDPVAISLSGVTTCLEASK